jgi:hypothetical protein
LSFVSLPLFWSIEFHAGHPGMKARYIAFCGAVCSTLGSPTVA